MNAFLTFLEDLKKEDNIKLLDVIIEGYQSINETYNIYANTGLPQNPQANQDMITEASDHGGNIEDFGHIDDNQWYVVFFSELDRLAFVEFLHLESKISMLNQKAGRVKYNVVDLNDPFIDAKFAIETKDGAMSDFRVTSIDVSQRLPEGLLYEITLTGNDMQRAFNEVPRLKEELDKTINSIRSDINEKLVDFRRKNI